MDHTWFTILYDVLFMIIYYVNSIKINTKYVLTYEGLYMIRKIFFLYYYYVFVYFCFISLFTISFIFIDDLFAHNPVLAWLCIKCDLSIISHDIYIYIIVEIFSWYYQYIWYFIYLGKENITWTKINIIDIFQYFQR